MKKSMSLLVPVLTLALCCGCKNVGGVDPELSTPTPIATPTPEATPEPTPTPIPTSKPTPKPTEVPEEGAYYDGSDRLIIEGSDIYYKSSWSDVFDLPDGSEVEYEMSVVYTGKIDSYRENDRIVSAAFSTMHIKMDIIGDANDISGVKEYIRAMYESHGMDEAAITMMLKMVDGEEYDIECGSEYWDEMAVTQLEAVEVLLNENGKTFSFALRSAIGSIDEYDDSNRKVKCDVYEAENGKWVLLVAYAYSYNGDGSFLASVKSYENGILCVDEEYYVEGSDSNTWLSLGQGDMRKYTEYHRNGKISHKAVSDGNNLEWIRYDESGNITYYISGKLVDEVKDYFWSSSNGEHGTSQKTVKVVECSEFLSYDRSVYIELEFYSEEIDMSVENPVPGIALYREYDYNSKELLFWEKYDLEGKTIESWGERRYTMECVYSMDNKGNIYCDREWIKDAGRPSDYE